MTTWLYFSGPLEEFKRLARLANVITYWVQPDDGHHQLRTVIGACLNWWPSTGTVTLQGNTHACEQLRYALESAIRRAGEEFEATWIRRA